MALQSPQVAAGGLADLGIVEEVSYGETPPNPQLKTFRRRSTSLTLTKDAYASEEVRSDRMVSDSRHGIRRANGDIVVELSPGSHEEAWEALLGGVWTSPANVALSGAVGGKTITLAPSAADETITATLANTDWLASDFHEGATVTFSGTGVTAYDGENFTILSIDANAAIAVLVGPPDFDYTIADVTLNAGTLALRGAYVAMDTIYRSFTAERAFSDIGAFVVYNGLRFNSAAVDLPPTGIATATFGMLGKNAKPISGASIDGAAEVILTDATLTSLTFDAGARTITAAAGSFATAGIVPGDKLLFDGVGLDGMPQNRNARRVIAVNAGVVTVAEAIASGTTSGAFTVTKVGLPDYLAAPTEEVLVAVSGVLLVNGAPVGTVTAASINIDNQMAGSEVVGANVMPVQNWGNQSAMTGSLTVLFDRGGTGEMLYNAFDEETDVSILLRMDNSDRSSFMAFSMPRVKINTGSIGDAAAEGLPVTVDYAALKPKTTDGGRVLDSQMVIYDATVAGVAPA